MLTTFCNFATQNIVLPIVICIQRIVVYIYDIASIYKYAIATIPPKALIFNINSVMSFSQPFFSILYRHFFQPFLLLLQH